MVGDGVDSWVLYQVQNVSSRYRLYGVLHGS